ncbi:methyltransferase [Microbacterium album]|uniref:Methyltransferase n=1 Tax=Microbacterium album TaxID=2053191 RepID=A0A917MN60_9MICO|nr:methyltransferase [Microbacterium album]GGH39141.1 hypothetical protein GCM10010921_10180 [Microbacterium album]
MSTTQTRRVIVAYGPTGAVGVLRQVEGGAYAVTMAGAGAPLGEYPTLEIAKSALCSHLKPGSPRPEFREH